MCITHHRMTHITYLNSPKMSVQQQQQSFVDCALNLARISLTILEYYKKLAIPSSLANVFTFKAEVIEDVSIQLENYISLLDHRYNKCNTPQSEEVLLWCSVLEKYLPEIVDNKFGFLLSDSIVIKRELVLSTNSTHYDVELSSIYGALIHPMIGTSNDPAVKTLYNSFMASILDLLVRAYPDKLSLHGVYGKYDAPRYSGNMAEEAGSLLDTGTDIMEAVIGELAPGTTLNQAGMKLFKEKISGLSTMSTNGNGPADIKGMASQLRGIISPELLKNLVNP